MAAVMGAPASAWAEEAAARLIEADQNLQLDSDFYVNFEGMEVDHKTIVYLVVLGQFIGFVGALVSGIAARNRKREIEALAEKLQEVNRQLRQQSRGKRRGMYSPVGSDALMSTDGVEDELANDILTHLRNGKALLKEGSKGTEALAAFDDALRLAVSKEAQSVLASQPKAERKARRGRGAALAQMGRSAEALDELKRVLDISESLRDTVGVGDAYGVIADLYTDLGDLDRAGKYYDEYIKTLNIEDVDMDDEKELEEDDVPYAQRNLVES